jgi:hypothetical protein
MDIYENIVVGNFLFGLGVKMGMGHMTTPIEPISINLLQQTPLDQRLGDVVVANARIFRMIEFERESNKAHKERIKWKIISDALDLEEAVDLIALSRKIHWYVNSDFRRLRSEVRSKIEVFLYLDFVEPKGGVALPEFIDMTAIEAISATVDERELWWCKRNMEVVACVLGDSSGTSGCLLLVVTGTGQLNYVPVNDIGDLIKTPQQLIERHQAPQMELSREAEVQRERPVPRQEHALRPEGPRLSLQRNAAGRWKCPIAATKMNRGDGITS